MANLTQSDCFILKNEDFVLLIESKKNTLFNNTR